MTRPLDRFRGCLMGLAVGDAVGTTVEFKLRGSFSPVTDMVGGGPFSLEPGQWTDDTSMALCLASSLLECEGFNADDQMRRYCQWADDGYLSSTGSCFDIGSTIGAALGRYRDTGDPFAGSADPASAGNGSIMRLAPIPMYFFPDQENVLHYAQDSSRTTHGAAECLDACRLLGLVLCAALGGHSKDELLAVPNAKRLDSPKVAAIARGEYWDKSESEIRTTGYVIDTLEAALWSFAMTDSFQGAILKAVNLGGDADTTAAVCGQVAGAFYGESEIPENWRSRLAMTSNIRDWATAIYESSSKPSDSRYD